MDYEGLERHLDINKDKFDVTTLTNTSGFTLMHLAAYKSLNRGCEILIRFVLK